jgi:Fe-S cluster biogenesis protein NfuA
VLDEGVAQPADTHINDDDSEVVALIKELLDTRIRPAVQDDGGDISFIDFDEDSGVVTVQLQGACSTCSSSKVTLKSGVENMLMHYVPEVTGVMKLCMKLCNYVTIMVCNYVGDRSGRYGRGGRRQRPRDQSAKGVR